MRVTYRFIDADISSYLKMDDHAITDDKRAMKQWETGRIDTDELIKSVCEHNAIPCGIGIIGSDFVEWVESLGYRRK